MQVIKKIHLENGNTIDVLSFADTFRACLKNKNGFTLKDCIPSGIKAQAVKDIQEFIINSNN